MTAADLFDGLPLSYAEDDGMPFPGWAPPALSEDEAAERFDAGDRFAVLAGEPTAPSAALVVDVRNARVVVTQASPRHVLVFTGKKELALTQAAWTSDAVEWRAETQARGLLRVRRRPEGAAVWVDELFARAGEPIVEPWPEFGAWSALARIDRDGPQWWQDGVLDPVDADGWLLDELDDRDITERWRGAGPQAGRTAGLQPTARGAGEAG